MTRSDWIFEALEEATGDASTALRRFAKAWTKGIGPVSDPQEAPHGWAVLTRHTDGSWKIDWDGDFYDNRGQAERALKEARRGMSEDAGRENVALYHMSREA